MKALFEKYGVKAAGRTRSGQRHDGGCGVAAAAAAAARPAAGAG